MSIGLTLTLEAEMTNVTHPPLTRLPRSDQQGSFSKVRSEIIKLHHFWHCNLIRNTIVFQPGRMCGVGSV